MSRYSKHLYAIMYPNQALVVSQLEPMDFGRYYRVGSARYYTGKTLFCEVDINFRHPYFDIDGYLTKTVEHPDGSPKHTKFVSSYRVLEHIPNEVLLRLYAVTASGQVLAMRRADPKEIEEREQVRIYQTLNPIKLLFVSVLDTVSFGRYVTAPGNPKGCPRVFFTQFHFNVEEFLRDWRISPLTPPPVESVHPQLLRQAVVELKENPEKKVRSIGIQSVFTATSYHRIKHGFFLSDQERFSYFAMPTEAELQADHLAWWRSM